MLLFVKKSIYSSSFDWWQGDVSRTEQFFNLSIGRGTGRGRQGQMKLQYKLIQNHHKCCCHLSRFNSSRLRIFAKESFCDLPCVSVLFITLLSCSSSSSLHDCQLENMLKPCFNPGLCTVEMEKEKGWLRFVTAK